MVDLNTVVIIGRLTRDLNTAEPREYSVTPNGQYRANVSVAVNSRKRNGDQWIDEANYFDVTIWGKTAENLHPFLKKGKQIAVEGFLKQDRWVDSTTGQNRSKVYIVANNVHLLGGNKLEGAFQAPMGNAPTMQQQVPNVNMGMQQTQQMPVQNYQPQQYNPVNNVNFAGNMDGFVEDAPF